LTPETSRPVPRWTIIEWNPPHLTLEVEGERRELLLSGTFRKPRVGWQGSCFSLERPTTHSHAVEKETDDCLSAPIHGTVIEIRVQAGDAVESGQVLLVIEAMKMELPIRSPRKGAIKLIHVATGEIVASGGALVELEQEPD